MEAEHIYFKKGWHYRDAEEGAPGSRGEEQLNGS